MKKVVSLLLALVMTVTCVSVPLSVSGEEPAAQTQTDISARGTNAFGSLLADALDEKLAEQTANNGYNVFSVEMEENLAVVSLETVEDCTLVVGVYDEAGEQMLASGRLKVEKGATDAVVEIETDAMPDYYYLRAFLVDSASLQPLCVAYQSPTYTREMQAFLARTTDDFDADRVLNLDEDKTNNFAVYGADTTIIRENGETNTVVRADEEQGAYVFENADSAITSLKPGDVFAYECADGEVLLVKVATITPNGTTVTITAADTSLEEVFDYVKIDAQAGTAQAEIDPSTCGEGITYTGLTDGVDEDAPQTFAVDVGGKTGAAASFQFADAKLGSAKVSGKVDFKLEVSAKVYLSWDYQYLELKLDYSAQIGMSLSDKGENKMPLAYMCIAPVPGVYVELVPYLSLKTNAKLALSATLEGTVGFRTANTDGFQNLTSTPSLKPTAKVEGTVFAGLSLEPKIGIICDAVAKVSLTAEVGGEIKGVLKAEPEKPAATEKHLCKACIDGDISAKLSLNLDVKLANWDKLTFKFTLADVTLKIADFYFSYDFADFGLTTCPHMVYQVTVTVRDEDGQAVEGATVAEGYTTDAQGTATLFLPNGQHRLSADKEGYPGGTVEVTVDREPTRADIYLHKAIGSVQTVSLGSYDSAAITTDGSLYMWGWNGSGQLGDGTTKERHTPVKIMDHVAAVSLGWHHSAAITTDGSLYMWGVNDYGQLGDGTTENQLTPVKIMENVAAVSLGGDHSAAVTTDGSLYMWGWNLSGRLGAGTTDYDAHPTPVKIMDHVAAVSLGGDHSAAITTDGSLYTWGQNIWGQLGDGTTEDRHTPVKIMENVAAVSLGDSQSAAVTTDGSLYMWGYNGSGALGDGTTEDRHTPVKIMENVAAVSLGWYHSAAITTDGSLYMWGVNGYGQLGAGTTDRDAHPTPVKIMDHVAAVNLGDEHSAAITTDGSLYMWGINCYGQLGDGTTEDQFTPVKIMDHVAAVSLGDDYSAAVTTDGSLYMWGRNYEGQLGDGTSEERHTPAKIMNNILLPGQKTAKTAPQKAPRRAAAKEAAAPPTTFTGLTPGGVYNVYAMKNREADDPLGADNLLYIHQLTADETGTLSVTVAMDEPCDTPDVFVVGMPSMRGDINNDGHITAADALLALKAATKQIDLTAAQKSTADVDHSGGVDIIDALMILQYAAGKITSF